MTGVTRGQQKKKNKTPDTAGHRINNNNRNKIIVTEFIYTRVLYYSSVNTLPVYACDLAFWTTNRTKKKKKYIYVFEHTPFFLLVFCNNKFTDGLQ